MCPANETQQGYIVESSLIGRAHAQTDPWYWFFRLIGFLSLNSFDESIAAYSYFVDSQMAQLVATFLHRTHGPVYRTVPQHQED